MKFLTGREMRDLGVLLEVNRQLLHPAGLAMRTEVSTPDIDEPLRLLPLTEKGLETLRMLAAHAREHGVIPVEHIADLERRLAETEETMAAAVLRVEDHRDDPEGVVFGAFEGIPGRLAKARVFAQLLADKAPARLRRFGWRVQPL